MRINVVDGFEDLELSQRGNNVEIDYGRGTVLVRNASVEDFGADDFLF